VVIPSGIPRDPTQRGFKKAGAALSALLSQAEEKANGNPTYAFFHTTTCHNSSATMQIPSAIPSLFISPKVE